MAAEPLVNWAKYRAIFERATQKMQENLERIALGGPMATVRVMKDRLFEASADSHSFRMDEPQARGGTGTAPSPMGYFTAGAAG